MIRAKSTTPSVTFRRRFAVSEHGRLDSRRVVLLLESAEPGHDHASQHVRHVSARSLVARYAGSRITACCQRTSYRSGMPLLACITKSRNALSLVCSILGLGLDRAAGSLGLSLQVIIIIRNRCNDRVPALLYALTQIGWASARLGRCSVQSANERLHTPSGVALTDVFHSHKNRRC